MSFYSPLRYPGGKNKLAKFIALICKKNNINGHYVEPYAGGASVALTLLIDEYVSEITINDLDRSIYAFWHSVLNETKQFCEMIEDTKIDLKNWKKQKLIQKDKNSAELLALGFSTFFLNRTNFSGVISGGVIGGLSQNGKYKIDCRFNKKDLIDKIQTISWYKSKITLCNLDALELIRKIKKDESTIFYFDPPYYFKGKSLYINHYKHRDHEAVSKEIQKIKQSRWIVSYDNTPEIQTMYEECQKKEYSFIHTARKAKEGREVLFFSNNLNIPNILNLIRINNFLF